ncbi:PLP-dependent aspartate aminotransferase family protein [Micromonospora peucetia]|uniref:homocysteine desulfhydrase n=1 Tax=Micromonospora peucetia TaxID=47871 RepID=A0A1C6VWU5_9ACTN|nr:PLP-dependent aspartate aminotransferase family protein [Micromonospora peucetia]MCX4387875.1 PLP-dependent aspartate aminotransferase family protein [Micromonospora peucetia]WSA31417.1 PLP-dependent aspartate aminotransferase family protein [Micromonospora peucetia]SCL70766.1 methionine-gamma-lyase [Micromonospora peucetia]
MTGTSTIAVHGDDGLNPGGAVSPPIVQSATFSAESDERFTAVATETRGQAFYTRYGNPNHAQVAAVVAELEGAEAGLVTASGMGAISTIALALLSAGDHVIVQRSTYGGTTSLVTGLLARFGVAFTQVDQTDTDAFARALRPQTRLVLVETPSNPLLELTDLAAVVELAHANDALVAVDNTFATPVNQRPADFGADLVWHSGTKYLGGHSDVSAGVIVGSADLVDRVWQTAIVTGSTLGPIDAWLLLRGIRTLSLRVDRHNANALALARAAEGHPAVRRVRYPGLPTHPQHELAGRQMTGFGGVLGIELRDGRAAAGLLTGLRLAKRAASLGSVSTLVVHPRSMWAGIVDAEQLAATGIGEGLVRVSTGIEDTKDLVADFLAALDAADRPE